MKTVSVKQVAEALDLTPRAVIYRLEKGQLKGTQQPNAFGKQEWRVYPTKEIVEGLKKQQSSENNADKEAGSFNFSPEDIDVVEPSPARSLADRSSLQTKRGRLGGVNSPRTRSEDWQRSLSDRWQKLSGSNRSCWQLKTELQQLRTPWWKKLFAAQLDN